MLVKAEILYQILSVVFMYLPTISAVKVVPDPVTVEELAVIVIVPVV